MEPRSTARHRIRSSTEPGVIDVFSFEPRTDVCDDRRGSGAMIAPITRLITRFEDLTRRLAAWISNTPLTGWLSCTIRAAWQ
jgi:hypothetical protein